MKKQLIVALLAIFTSFNNYAANHEVKSLKALCSTILGQKIQDQAHQIVHASSQEEAKKLIEQQEGFIPTFWMPDIIDNTDLQWEHKQIKQATPIKQTIKITDNKRILTQQAQQEYRQKIQNAEIRDMVIGSKPIHGERPLYVTRRDGRTDVFTLESGEYIASFHQAQKPKIPQLMAPIKDDFTWSNNKYLAQAAGTHVQVLCNNNQIGDIALPTTRGGKQVCASSLKLDEYKQMPHLFIGTDNGKLLRVAINGTKLGELLTLMRGPRKDSGHSEPIRDIFVTPNKQHITTTSTHTFRNGPITPSSKEQVRTKLNFNKDRIIQTSSSTGDIVSGGDGQNITIQSKNLDDAQLANIGSRTTSILTSPIGKHIIVGTSNGNVHQFTHPHERASSLKDLRGDLVLQEVQKQMLHASPNSKKRLSTIKEVVEENKKKKQKTK